MWDWCGTDWCMWDWLMPCNCRGTDVNIHVGPKWDLSRPADGTHVARLMLNPSPGTPCGIMGFLWDPSPGPLSPPPGIWWGTPLGRIWVSPGSPLWLPSPPSPPLTTHHVIKDYKVERPAPPPIPSTVIKPVVYWPEKETGLFWKLSIYNILSHGLANGDWEMGIPYNLTISV